MQLKRRDFIQLSGQIAGAGILATAASCRPDDTSASAKQAVKNLNSKTGNPQPITFQEREMRIKKARQLLHENHMEALVIEAGTALTYFTGITWWPSERPMVAIIPHHGEVCYVCPAFEEARLKELTTNGKDIFVWQEDESPYEQVANALKSTGIEAGNIGIEERVRFFIVDGIRKFAPQYQLVSAEAVSAQCRLVKSSAEIDLMQIANDITSAAMRLGIQYLREGMSPAEFSAIVAAAHEGMGAQHDFALANFGAASAFPHGSSKPQSLRPGDIVLMDCGCRVEGYSADISRTIVFGAEPSKRQLEIWNLEKEAQAAGFAAAQVGAPCEAVDAAARAVLERAGFGPGYKLPGLPHRTGHGIGMDGHEWGNMVKGNSLPLVPGMCFSIEPNISIPGEFGVRLEDCVYMTESGPRWFSCPSPAIDQPFV
jgi:Xaa-Pro dipeptidase